MPTPPANALYTTFQVGSYNATTDSFTTVLDLNDRTTYWLMANGLTLAQPEKIDVRSNNIRTPGEKIVRVQDKNRHITYTMWIKSTTPQGVVTALRTLIQAIQTPPYVIRLALPGATQYSYADVVKVSHDIPANTQEINASALTRVSLHFECAPYFRGDRQWLQNLANNPGFEQGSGPSVTVFSDAFTNTNAYSVQAGGALTADKGSYADAVQADAPTRYFRLDEASGTVAYDAAQVQNGAYTGAGITYGVTGALTGDSDTAVTFNGTTGRIASTSTVGLPTGNGAVSLECWIKIAANPAASAVPLSIGDVTMGSGHYLQLVLNTTGTIFGDGAGTSTPASAALTLNVWHYILLSWNGTTLSLTVDNNAATTNTGPAMNITYITNALAIGAQCTNAGSAWLPGSLDEVAVYGTALSAARATAHYSAGTTTPATATNSLLIPSGGRVSFGSPRWRELNGWRLRFRYVAGLTWYAYLHYTDASNYVRVEVSQTQIVWTNVSSGTTTTLTTTSLGTSLVLGVHYWLTVYQFPSTTLYPDTLGSTHTVYLTATVLTDNAIAIATAIAASASYIVTTDNGQPQLQAVGAALALGLPNSTAAGNIVGNWGPGGWTMSSTGTGVASGTWEIQHLAGATTYGAGPTVSNGAALLRAAPAGTLNASWVSGTVATPLLTAAPVAAAGDVLGVKAYVTSSGVGSGCVQSLWFTEYDYGGSFLRTGAAVASVAGAQASWTLLSGTYTTGASCAFVLLTLNAADATAGSVNGSVWWDDVQVWDQTQTGMTTMPYCELRSALAPAQLVVSGVLGDVPAPALVMPAIGFTTNLWATNRSFTLYLGRRAASTTTGALLFHAGITQAWAAPRTVVIDASSYCGFYMTTTDYVPMSTYIASAAGVLGTYEIITRNQLISGVPSTTTLAIEADIASFSNALSANPAVTPYAGTGNWSLVDLGKFAPVFSASGSLIQYSANSLYLNVKATAPSGLTLANNYLALLPLDGEVLVWTLTNQIAGGTYGYWAIVYADGQNATNGLTVNHSASPTPSNALVNGTTGGSIAAAMTGATQPVVDPTQTNGVNQYVLIVQDSAGLSTPVAVDILYSPRYLYPR